MKNIILTLIALSFITNTSKAQSGEESRTKLHFGVKAGINYSNIYDSQGEDFEAESKVGFAGGVFVAIPIGEYFGIQPEVLFSQKGFKSTGTILGNKYEATRTTNHVDVPLLVAFKPIPALTILAGPQYSYLLSTKNAFTNSLFSTAQESEFAKDDVRTNTLCFTGGFDINVSNFVISGRAGWDLRNNKADGTSTTPRYKNAWYQATVGFRF